MNVSWEDAMLCQSLFAQIGYELFNVVTMVTAAILVRRTARMPQAAQALAQAHEVCFGRDQETSSTRLMHGC